MKKRLFSVAAVACAAALCTVLFAACGGEEEPGDQPGVPVTYTIAAEPSEDYTLTPSKTSAEAGEVITVTAESKNADKYITGVTFNGTACEEEEDGYSFTMPAANVTLAAQTGTYAEKLTGDFMFFSGLIPDTIAVYENEWDYEDKLYVSFSEDVNIGTGDQDEYVQVTSSDQSVIPDSALRCYVDKDGSFIESAIVYIAVNDIKPGTAYVSLTVQDSSISSKNETIVKKLTVVEAEDLEIPAMSVEFTFDLSAVEDVADELIISINDYNDLIYGSEMSLQKTVVVAEEADLSEVTFTMDNFAVGHTYSVGVQFMNGEDHYAFAKMNSLTNSKGSFDGSWLKLEEAEAVDFGTLTAYSVG